MKGYGYFRPEGGVRSPLEATAKLLPNTRFNITGTSEAGATPQSLPWNAFATVWTAPAHPSLVTIVIIAPPFSG